MIRKARTFLRRFRREEHGYLSIEFALALPLIFTLFLTSVEMGIYALRQGFLDRGLDMAVRNVRLNTGTNYSHSDIKQMVCDFSGFLPDCDASLKLEMNPINPRNFNGFGGSADCTDITQPVTPSRSFVHGGEHQMMLLRACYKFKPIFPTTGLGYALTKDGSGRAKMVSMSAFVQEPGA